MNEKLTAMKTRAKSKIKEHAPVIITVAASALALVACSAYIAYCKSPNGIAKCLEDDVEIIDAGDEYGYMVLDPETKAKIIAGVSEICFKLGENLHYRLTQIDCTQDH